METTVKFLEKKEEKRANYDVYVCYLWRKGLGRKYELYKYTNYKEITDLGKSESCFLWCKKGETMPNIPHNRLEWQAATTGKFTINK